MAPFISVVTPSLNQAKYVRRCIDSVLNQRYSSFEHWVIDGASVDETQGILKSYSHLQWVSEPDSGIPQALNKALDRVRGEVIAWINSDDFYTPGTFEKVAQFFSQNPEACVWVGRAAVVDEHGRLLFYQEEPGPGGFTHGGMVRFWKNCTLPQPSVFFRRRVLEKMGGMDEALKYYMDYDFFLRLSREHTFYRTHEVLSCIGLHWGASSVRDIAKGRLHKALYKISRRYWGSKKNFRYWGHFFSYLTAWPGLAWKVYYDRFVFEIKRQTGWTRPEVISAGSLWNMRKQLIRYPFPALFATFKFLCRRMQALFGSS